MWTGCAAVCEGGPPMCRVWVTLSRVSLGAGSEFVGPVVGFPVASLPGACPPLAHLAVSPGCLAVSPGACNYTVISALAHAKKLGNRHQEGPCTCRGLPSIRFEFDDKHRCIYTTHVSSNMQILHRITCI